MDDTKINKVEINSEKQLFENSKNINALDTSLFDETLKEIDQILNDLEQKLDGAQNQSEKQNVLPELNSAISKIHTAKNELIKEENIVIKNNDLVKRIEALEKNDKRKNIDLLENKLLNQETVSEIKEHEIDKTLLSIDELHNFSNVVEKKKKSSLGFYSYLVIFLIFFLTCYGILNFSKELIILKYPFTKIYIEYFYEIIEIIKITFLNFIENI